MASLYNVGSPSKDVRWNHGILSLTSGWMFCIQPEYGYRGQAIIGMKSGI